jgi:hypothetical protein
METVCFSETLVSTYKSTRRYNPEDQHRHLRRRENLKSHVLLYFLFTVVRNVLKIIRQRQMGYNSDRTQLSLINSLRNRIKHSKIQDENPLTPELLITACLQHNMLNCTNRFLIIFALVPILHCVPFCYRILSSYTFLRLSPHCPFTSSAHDTLRQSDRQRWVAGAGTPGVSSLSFLLLHPKGPPAPRRTQGYNVL